MRRTANWHAGSGMYWWATVVSCGWRAMPCWRAPFQTSGRMQAASGLQAPWQVFVLHDRFQTRLDSCGNFG